MLRAFFLAVCSGIIHGGALGTISGIEPGSTVCKRNATPPQSWALIPKLGYTISQNSEIRDWVHRLLTFRILSWFFICLWGSLLHRVWGAWGEDLHFCFYWVFLFGGGFWFFYSCIFQFLVIDLSIGSSLLMFNSPRNPFWGARNVSIISLGSLSLSFHFLFFFFFLFCILLFCTLSPTVLEGRSCTVSYLFCDNFVPF